MLRTLFGATIESAFGKPHEHQKRFWNFDARILEKQSVQTQRTEHHVVISKELECCVSSAMERSELLKRLEQVEQQVRQVTELIARQRRILAELNKVLVDTDDPQILLQRYLQRV
jgi:hypothetical protein